MDLMLLRVFQNQVLLQCRFVLLADQDYNSSEEQRDVIRSWFAIQNMLNAAANISKALWGQRGRFAAERKDLRDSIGISDDSPLKHTTIRNNFEHFIERLDRWWVESRSHNFVDMTIGNVGLSVAGVDDSDMFRSFDPLTGELAFWGQHFNTQEIVNEVVRILPKVAEEAAKPHWER